MRLKGMKYEVLIVDDHPLYREALRGAVAAACPDCEFFEGDSVAGLFELLDARPSADLLLLDLNLPGACGFSALAHVRASHPELPVVVVSALDEPRVVRQALGFGAQGYVSKSADAASIGRNIQAIMRGEVVAPNCRSSNAAPQADAAALDVAQRIAQLTPQQFRVLGMLCSGRLNKQIAYDMKITEATVKAHMTVVLRKIGAVNRTQAVLLAGRLAVDPSDFKALPEDIE